MGELNRAGLQRVALVSSPQGEAALMDRAEAAGPRRLGRRACRPARRAVARLWSPPSRAPVMPPAMEVSFVDEVGLDRRRAAARRPRRAAAARRPNRRRRGRRPGADAGAAAAPAPPEPAPRAGAAPAPRRRAAPRPAPPAAAAAPAAPAPRAPRLGDIDPRGFGSDPAARADQRRRPRR